MLNSLAISVTSANVPRVGLFLDVTRACTRILRSSPTGIDRVEFAYLAEALNGIAGLDTYYVVTAPTLNGVIRDDRIKRIYSQIERVWGRNRKPLEDPVYARLKPYLESSLDLGLTKAARFQGLSQMALLQREMIFPFRDFFRSGVRLRRRLLRTAQTPTVYFHSSHMQLEKPARFAWLKDNALASVFLIHDVIPFDYPEFFPRGARERHLRRLQTVSELASLVVVNSNYTARSLRDLLRERGLRVPPIGVSPLGVDRWFLDLASLEPPKALHPYAVFVGTIEPRKNLAFLLAVWRRLVERHGPKTPRLVIAGKRGWENENVKDLFERSHALAPYVIEVSDLSDSGLASTLAGAECLVAPSLVEGFSLPVVEALSLGIPVLASDIDVHREVAQGRATLLDPLDGPAWVRAIEAFCDRSCSVRAEAADLARGYRPTTWPQHVASAVEMILSVAKPMT